MELAPLRRRDFRLLYFGQFVSFFGSMMSYVALPYALYAATKSTVLTGLLGVIQLLPSVVGGLFGGALADAFDRRKLIVGCEIGMALVVLAVGWALHATAPGYPAAPWLLAAAFALSMFNGVHRPALEALTPQLVPTSEMPAAAVLTSFRGNVGMIGGPAVAGMLISAGGAYLAFFVDAVTFVLAIGFLLAIENMPKVERAAEFSLAAVREGFRYAMSRQVLVGTYVVDIVAMAFSMPNLLFPAVAEQFGGANALGWLHAGISSGAVLAALTSGRLMRARRHGLLILVAAGSWSLFMLGFGLAPSFALALVFLVLAGYADMISGAFRQTIWNQTVPSELRGRLAGIEMISYLTGPLVGNTQLGFLAEGVGVQRAIAYSSLIGFAGVCICARVLPRFRSYVASEPEPARAAETTNA